MRYAAGLLAVLVCSSAIAAEATPRTLTSEDRVKAQAAIERVYYSHQTGTTKPFEQAVPRAVLEAKVRKYLDQTAALKVYWNTPVTGAMLQSELQRMANGTRMPERLLELFAALGNDPFLVQECVARATLVDRLAKNFYAFDPSIHAKARAQIDTIHDQLASGSLLASTEQRNRTVIDIVVSASPTQAGLSLPARPFEQQLTPDEFKMRRAEFPARVGQVSNVKVTSDAFAIDVVLSESATSVRIASYVIQKTPWDYWWATAIGALRGESISAVASNVVDLPAIRNPRTPCTADDTWDNGMLNDPPNARSMHTAVWTGSQMIVWGGMDDGYSVTNGGRYDPATDSWTSLPSTVWPSTSENATAVWTGNLLVVWSGSVARGARYDPSADTWMPMSTIGAPTARQGQTAVWAGNRMVIWGGFDIHSGIVLNTGGTYDPATDTWMPTSLTGAPFARGGHTAVATGSRMVVWGGTDHYYNDPTNTGGRYDPETDSWMPTSLGVNVPSAKKYHSAVWTGTEMIVWGGVDSTGGRYDPLSDTWKPMSAAGAPSPRTLQTVVWTGTEMIVWGGIYNYSPVSNIGGRYNPATDSWTPTTATGAPSPRQYHSAVWTGSMMIVWGGVGDGYFGTGGRYSPATDSWTPTSTVSAPVARGGHAAVWTGSLMVVWGGQDQQSNYFISGGRYDPVTESWTSTSVIGAPSPRFAYTAVWSGHSMVVWGGQKYVGDHYEYYDTGGRYDPLADVWMPTSLTGAPDGRANHTAVWTGSRMIIWGGARSDYGDTDTGGLYDPLADSWVETSTIGAPSARYYQTAVWTGSRMVVWGGYDNGRLQTGGRYDPATDLWATTSTTGAPTPRYAHKAVQAGSVMVVWGGYGGDSSVNTGGRYDPVNDVWAPTSTSGAPTARENPTVVWTGAQVVVWGGRTSGVAPTPGGRYDPATDAWMPTSTTNAPTDRAGHTAVWTGSQMIVCGGYSRGPRMNGGRYILGTTVDNDNDGFSECQGDCNDADPATYPGAPQFCDGKNTDCNDPSWPALPADEADADHDGFSVCHGDCDDTNAAIHPGAPESCNGIDDNCDGVIDDGGGSLCDDGNPCTDDACASTGVCVFTSNTIACDDGNACTAADTCGNSVCRGTPTTGNACNDGNACTIGDTCHSGVCAGMPRVCDDGSVCTDDSCNPSTGCVFVARPPCNDGNVCTDDTCDPVRGCVYTNNLRTCSDGNVCTVHDVCQGGQCTPGTPVVCNDLNPCTSDTCIPATGCVFSNTTNACDDGSACTVGDRCGGGSCRGTPIVCNDGNPCTDDSCNPSTGACVYTNDDTNACSDGNPCTQTDSCHAGACNGSNVLQCSGNCPAGSTQVGGLCQRTYDIGAGLLDNLNVYCDGTGANRYNDCNGANYGFHWTDLVTGLAIVARVDVQLESGLTCVVGSSGVTLNGVSVGSFNPAGFCDCFSAHATISLPNVAAGAYAMSGVNAISIAPSSDCEGLSKGASLGSNFARVTVTYAPHLPECQVAACDPATGTCRISSASNGTACSDGNACTGGDACGGGACRSGTAVDCNDDNPCTTDTCDPASGCIYTNNTDACSDGNACTAGDVCGDGICHSGTSVVCNDNNPCTTDTCDPALGCVYSNNGDACSDGNACTAGDACVGGSCHSVTVIVCNDNNPCTTDTCDPASGCVYTNNSDACSDGNACTAGDTCGGGTCHSGTAVVCNDNNLCTTDVCDPASGCVYTNNSETCSDGNACTSGDVCGGGTCHSGTAVVCNDNNPCTTDSCDPATGCVHGNNTNPCNDGNTCTTSDTCASGVCVGGSPLNCDDGNCCTIDSCNPATGCAHVPNTARPVFTTQPSFGSAILWPPEHGYADFTVTSTGAAVSSSCGVASIQFSSCSSSQPENTTAVGDGNTIRDCVYEPAGLHVRVERDGNCSPIGRVYTTTVVATDVCGNVTSSNPFDIGVWNDRSHQPTAGTIKPAADGSGTLDTRSGTNGTYGTGCGSGSSSTNGTVQDHSDADPDMEVDQFASVDVNSLALAKSGGNVTLAWTAPTYVTPVTVTRYHVYRLDPVALLWTQIAEVAKQYTSYQDPILNDGRNWQYRITAVIK